MNKKLENKSEKNKLGNYIPFILVMLLFSVACARYYTVKQANIQDEKEYELQFKIDHECALIITDYNETGMGAYYSDCESITESICITTFEDRTDIKCRWVENLSFGSACVCRLQN